MLPMPFTTESTVPAETSPLRPVHVSVLLDEVVEWLVPKPDAVFVDGTVGAGGHSAALARKLEGRGRVIGLDRDPNMLAFAQSATEGLPVALFQAPYSRARDVLDELGIGRVDGVLLDLGLSSDQLAWTDRGFSFAAEGPLDMRFDPQGDTTAADLVNSLPAEELANIIFQYGEDRNSRRIARRIVEERKIAPILTTGRLAEIVRKSTPGKWGPMDPATRTFQALRIRVNDELEHLDRILDEIPELLKVGGRAVIISFHSLEDRKVKWAFRNDPRLNVLTRKPLMASAQEVAENPRARSAKMRVAERCSDTTPTTNPTDINPSIRTVKNPGTRRKSTT